MERVVRIDGNRHRPSAELPTERPDAVGPEARPGQETPAAHLLHGSDDQFAIDLQEIASQTAEIWQLVNYLVAALAGLSSTSSSVEGTSAFSFGASQNSEDRGENKETPPTRLTRSPLPDPRLLRHIIRHRQRRAHFFGAELFADPAWDMLLDLAAARAEHKRVSVTSLCIASGVPPTTALRWIGLLAEAGLVERTEDDTDRRRAFITLSTRGADAMVRFFAAIGDVAPKLV